MVGGWVELGRTTLGSASDNVIVGSLSDKRYYMVLSSLFKSGQTNHLYRLNGDTGNNYSYRLSIDGEADSTTTSISFINTGGNTDDPHFQVGYFSNLATKEKLLINHGVDQNTAGAGTAPRRAESAGKWVNATDPISEIRRSNTDSGDFASGSELVVLGWDPSDVHTTNFWEELANVKLTSDGDNLSSGTITAKKYLWVQYALIPSGDTNALIRFNNDTNNNYARRISTNGGADVTESNTNFIDGNIDADSELKYGSLFIINTSANEKLVINHIVHGGASGAGSSPDRREVAGKWVNTTNQITEIDIDNTATGSYASGSIMKVWGAD